MKGTNSIFIVVILLLVSQAYAQKQRTLPGFYLDQAPWQMTLRDECQGNPGTANKSMGWWNTDFQNPPYVSETGLVGPKCTAANGFGTTSPCGKLNGDRLPTYAYPGKSALGTVRSPDSFYMWFHPDAPQGKLVEDTITLTQLSTTSLVYGYESYSFFPLDGKGWQDQCLCRSCGNHNYGFCFQAHSRFGYSGGEVFNFLGDDDVFVYIDGKLVIDIGGIHSAVQQNIAVDTLGLAVNKSYRFDFFYCERHTTGSNIQIQTTLDLYCSYTDICGVCEGNGLTCCNSSVIATYCNDNNVCTIDSCSATIAPWQDSSKGCVRTPITCPAPTPIGSKCNTTAACDPINGCQYQMDSCDDGDSCTIDRCDHATGCHHDPVVCTGDKCTDSKCVAGRCVTTDLSSNCDSLSNGCKRGYCDRANGCSSSSNATVCTQNVDKCNTGSCDPNQGCKLTPITCDTSNKCLSTACNPSVGCQSKPIACNAPDACSIAVCNNATGCSITKKNCDDGDGCTEDTCDPTAGCVHNTISCDDANSCTADSCVASSSSNYTCVRTPISNCLDCGGKACNTSTDPCNPLYCDTTANECKTRPYTCTNPNKCTTSACVVTNGKAACNNTAISCPAPANACFVSSCDPATGCQTTAVNCDDGNACTTDSCDASTGAAVCKNELTVCGGDACAPQACDAADGKCKATTAPSCDDDNKCTEDQCQASNGTYTCLHTLKQCGDACNPATCAPENGTCVAQPIVCAAPNQCSTATFECLNGTTPTCTIAALNDSVCDDNNNCTNDFCDSGALAGEPRCIHTNITCTPTICQTAACNATAGGCVFTPIVCPGVNDRCKIASCDATAGCIAENVVCAPADPGCYIGMCNSTAGCYQVERPDFRDGNQFSTISPGVLCVIKYDKKAKIGLAAGATAGVVIGAVAAAGLIGFGGKKGYDFIQARNSGISSLSSNPLYEAKPGGGENPLYVNK